MVGGSLRVLQLLPSRNGRHEIPEILLKVALSNKNQIKSNHTIMACIPPRKSFLSSVYIFVEPVIVLSITEMLGWVICKGV
jgi:hypothetical protein